jgi:putative ABC transport system ATP-binding protein
MPDQPLVSLAHLSLTYSSASGKVEALKDIGFEMTAGESVGVIGPSGSGKSSLMMVLAGLERPTLGQVHVAGQDMAHLDEDALAKFRGRTMGIVFQDFHLIDTMTALENVALPLEFAGNRDAVEIARTMLGEVGLAQRTAHYPGQLSGGEQQRVALARALAPKPHLVLADEPTGNLDQETGATIIDLIFRQCEAQGSGLLLITHDMNLAARCGRQVTMRDGKLSK